MKLERLEVTNWRGIDHQVIEFSDGVTIVGGPNECGKTSLRAALYAALLAPLGKSGEKKKLEANRPWKTSLYPKVHLQVNIDGKTCVVEKEFLRKKEWASLRIDGRLIAQDDEVQPNLRKLLGESAEWIDALWGVQGDANLDCPAPESVKGRLADAARDTVMPQVNELEDLLSKEYGEYWTPKTGKPKSSIQELRQATITAEDQVTEIERKIESADQQSAEIDRKDKELEKTRNLLAELAKKWKEGQAALGQWEIYERAQLQATTAKKDAERAQQWLESWKNSLQELPTLTKSSSEWQDLVESLKRELQKEPTREAIDGLTAKKNFLQISIAYDTYTQVNAIQAPNNIELNRLKQLEKTLSEIKARLNAGAMKATLSPEKAPLDVILRVDGKQPASEQLSPPSRKEWTAENSFDLQIPGIARLTVEAGGTDIKADVSKRDEIENELAQVLQTWKSATLDELLERATRKELELRSSIAVTEEQMRTAAATFGEPAQTLMSLSIDEKKKLVAEVSSELADAEKQWKDDSDKHRALNQELERLREQNPPLKLEGLLKRMSDLLRDADFFETSTLVVPASPSECNDEWIAKARSLQAGWEVAAAKLAGDAQALQLQAVRPEGDPITTETLEALDKQVQTLRQQVQVAEGTINQMIGAVNEQGDLHARLVQAQEALAKAEAVQKQADTNAMSVRELYLAFDEARRKLQKDVVAPLADSVTDCFAELTDGFYERVAFDASLKLSGLSTSQIDQISLDDISFGTREQLLLLTRLCLAELLSKSGAKQVVILDDNLVHTDEKRMEYACDLLYKKSKDVQIIVFTCHPERYKRIADCRELILA